MRGVAGEEERDYADAGVEVWLDGAEEGAGGCVRPGEGVAEERDGVRVLRGWGWRGGFAGGVFEAREGEAVAESREEVG